MEKNAIKKFATWARRELIERVKQQAYRYSAENENVDMNANAAHGVVFTPVQRSQRQALIERIKAKGADAVFEEVAYTWFDRFCALRFMEVNGYLPGKTRMFSDENGAFRPQILTDALNIELPGLNIDTVISLKEENKTEELFKYFLMTMCNTLKPILTLFQPDDRGCAAFDRDYTWLLLPDGLLREGSVPEQMVLTIPEEDWKDAVQIVGWLYQYYNAEPKDQVFARLKKNIKISKKDIPAATQLFTPDWIVRYMVENSLGRLWVEGHPDDSLKANWKYYLEEAEQEPEAQAQLAKIRESYAAIKPEDILCIDPCMGSGHILVYMFDVLVQIYETYGYPTREAVASIVQNNLWGLDIDDRAAQLANFAVMMVARRYDKGWFRRGIQPHVMAIQESDGINRGHLDYLGRGMSSIERNNAVTQMKRLLDEFIDAKEYGSILRPAEYDWNLLMRFVEDTTPGQQLSFGEVGLDATQVQLRAMIEQGKAMSQKYHVVVTNPPYMTSGNLSTKLQKYIQKEYYESKPDLFAVMTTRLINMLYNNMYAATITQHVWMFLSRFEEFRKNITKNDIVNMAHLGAHAFDELGGEVVQTTTFILRKTSVHGYKSIYRRLVLQQTEEAKREGFLRDKKQYVASLSDFDKIPGSPVAYWASKKLIDGFSGDMLGDISIIRQGLATGDNDKYLRLWFEVWLEQTAFHCSSLTELRRIDRKYIPITKGGGYRKWFGNNEYLLAFDKTSYSELEVSGNCLPSRHLYFRSGLTWSNIAVSATGFRRLETGFAFSNKGAAIFCDDEIKEKIILSFLNSKVAEQLLLLISPSIGFEPGYIASLTLKKVNKDQAIIITELTDRNIGISKADWDSFETSWDFQRHPLLPDVSLGSETTFIDSEGKLGSYTVASQSLANCYEHWKNECEYRFNQLKANEEELNRIFIDIYGLQDELTPDVDDKDVTVRKADLGRDIRSLISYAVGCMLGRYSLDKPSLAFAGGTWDLSQYKTYPADADGILPITDDEYFDDDIVGMFVNWVRTVYGADTLEENLKFIASAVYPTGSGTARELIRQYFLNDFYKDHLKIYQKRPIYWMFDAGRQNSFKCLIYLHRYRPDTVARVRTDYVHEMQSRYLTAIEELTRRVNGASGSERVRLQKQLTKVQEQDAELLRYEEKVHHLADQMIAIDLDDGVKHNYAIFEDVLAPLK